MKKIGLVLVLLLCLAIPSVFYLGALMLAREEAALLLFTRYDEATSSTSINVLNADTGEERQIAVLAGHFGDAGWSPDGRIWLVDTVVEGERRLRFFDVETGEETIFGENLHLNTCNPSLRWSPDGERLAYVTGEQNALVLKMLNLTDGSHYQLPIQYNEMPFWSLFSDYFSYLERAFTFAAGRGWSGIVDHAALYELFARQSLSGLLG
jgi:dipeptidyl aminopeptidase/acylaminoacyl peptidase